MKHRNIKLTDWQVLAIEEALRSYSFPGVDSASLQKLRELISKTDTLTARVRITD